MSLRSVTCLFLGLGLCGLLQAAPPSTEEVRKVVTTAAEHFIQAFDARDGKKVAALFTPEAEYIDGSGAVFHGRAAIEAEYAASFESDPKGTIDIDITSIRPIAAGIIVEEGVSTFQPAGDGSASRMHYTATHVKQQDGSWLMASVRELATEDAAPHDYLKSMDWLVGQWWEETNGNVIRSEWKWSADGNFLMSEFDVKGGKEGSMKGTHRLGWDGERKQFRSWVFESSGGYSEGYWTPLGDGAWAVQLSGVDATGTRRSSLGKYQRDGADAMVVSLEQRVRGGITLPDLSHRIVRQPPKPGVAGAAAPVKAKPAQ